MQCSSAKAVQKNRPLLRADQKILISVRIYVHEDGPACRSDIDRDKEVQRFERKIVHRAATAVSIEAERITGRTEVEHADEEVEITIIVNIDQSRHVKSIGKNGCLVGEG